MTLYNETIYPVIANKRYTYRFLNAIQIYIDNESLIYNGDELVFASQEIKQETWYSEAILSHGSKKWSSEITSEGTGNRIVSTIALCRSLLSLDNRTLGVLRVSIRQTNLNDLIKLEDDDRLQMIANEQGIIIAATDPGFVNQNIGNYPFLKGVYDHESGFYDSLRQGEEIKVIYNTSATTSNAASQYWKVISIIAVDNLLIGTRNTLRFGILICLLILMVMGVFTFILSKGITLRISKLVERTHLVSSGDFTESVDIPGSDEIAELGQSFNIMVRNLNQLVNEVYEGKIKMQEYIIKKKEAELTALQNQINPHFLYNTLDAIRMHAIINNSESLADMLTSLSALLRYSISRGKEIVTMADEIKHVANYISIINMKHDNGVSLVTQIPEELLDVHILKLILQPIVENAFLHGIKGKMHTAEIRIIVSILDETTMTIDIIDNGEGMSDDRLKQINDKLSSIEQTDDAPHGSIGLNNVNSRIKLYFGMMYGLTIASEYGAGTTVRIRIPYQIKATLPDDKRDGKVDKDNEHA